MLTLNQNFPESSRSTRAQLDVSRFFRAYGNGLSESDRKAALDVINGRRDDCYVSIGDEIFYLTGVEHG